MQLKAPGEANAEASVEPANRPPRPFECPKIETARYAPSHPRTRAGSFTFSKKHW